MNEQVAELQRIVRELRIVLDYHPQSIKLIRAIEKLKEVIKELKGKQNG